MSGGSVCVLAPNGRRNTVKCTPNTIILQILEEACRKQNLKPEDYDLKHHNKILDTTTTFRFSGLPNNAQLELVPATKLRLESEITLAINLENGDRLVGNFEPKDTLLTILNKTCPESISQDKSPVVIYTRREIYGSELETVTLKSLGLTGGRAMIRLIHRTPEELKNQAYVAVPLPSKPVEEKPYVRKLQVTCSPEEVEPPKSNEPHEVKHSDIEKEVDDQTKPKHVKNQSGPVDILKLAKEKRKAGDFARSIKEEKRPSLSEKHTEIPKLHKGNCDCQREESMEVDCGGKCEESCTSILQENVEDQFVFLGERNAMLFSLETAQAVPSENLPDDFFDLTIDDAKKLIRDVKRQYYSTENTPLMTAALRNLEDSKKQLRQLNRYKKAIIRIQFPDRTVLQGTFAPIDTIKCIIEFVQEYLEDRSLEFYVCKFHSPKQILDEKSLIELGFVPGAMIHFGTDVSPKKSSYLRRDLQDKFTSNSVASLAASKMRSENTRMCKVYEDDDDFAMDDTPSIVVTNAGASTSTGITHDEYGERKIVSSTENVPKWFRP